MNQIKYNRVTLIINDSHRYMYLQNLVWFWSITKVIITVSVNGKFFCSFLYTINHWTTIISTISSWKEQMHIRARFIRLNLVFTNFDFKKYQSSFLVQSLPRIDINVFYKVPKYRKVSPTYHSLKHIFFSSGKL